MEDGFDRVGGEEVPRKEDGFGRRYKFGQRKVEDDKEVKEERTRRLVSL
jgi:hypothetical protein